MRRPNLLAVAAAALLWSLSGSARAPGDGGPGRGPGDDKPGRGPRALPSHARPPGSLFPPVRPSAAAGERGRPPEARREALRARLEELRRSRDERRAKRLEALRERYPAAVLADARVRDEFRLHARRMARLRRAELVAKTELEEPRQGQVLARVKRLVELEEARHEKRLTHLRSAVGPAASASGRPATAPPKGSEP